MSEDIDKFVAIVNRNLDSYGVRGKLSEILGDEVDLSELAWEARRAGKLDARHTFAVSDLLRGAPFDVDDYASLLADFSRAFPDGKVHTSSYSYSTLWEDKLEGWCDLFHELLEPKIASEPAFLSALAERTDAIPDPVKTGARYILAYHEHYDPERLPEDLIHQLARAAVSSEERDLRFVRDFNPWPEERWRGALIRALFDSNVPMLLNFALIPSLIPHLDDRQLPLMLARVGTRHDETLDIALATSSRPASSIGPLEEAILTAPDDAWRHVYQEPYGGFHLMMSYAVLCGAHGHVPDARMQAPLTSFVSSFAFGWSGSGLAEYRTKVYDVVRLLPLDMLDEAINTEGAFRWELAGAILTARCARLSARQLALPPDGHEYDFSDKARTCFLSLDADLAVPALSEAILADLYGHVDRRVLAAEFVSMFQDARAAEALAHMLSDSSKKVRDAATAGLKSLPADAALDAIEAPLNARKKDAREAAASVLLALPASTRRHALAAARLEKEKSKSVVELLERVEVAEESDDAGADVGDAVMVAGLARLEQTDGAAWPALVDAHGVDAAVAIYVRFLEARAHDTYLYSFQAPIENWAALVGSAPAESVTGPVVHVAAYSDPSDYFDTILEDTELPELAEQLRDRVLKGRFSHPTGADETGWRVKHRMDESDASRWLAEHHPAVYAPLALAQLAAKKKTDRDAALDFVTANPETVSFEDLTPMLSARRADEREYAAHALGALGAPGARGALEARLSAEKSSKVEAAIELAIAAIASSSFDAAAFDAGAEGDAALDAAISAQPVVGPPGKLDSGLGSLPSPTWVALGEPMSGDALRWFVSELAREDEERHSGDLIAVRARLDDESCHALCEAMITLRGSADSDWGLYPQAIIASPERIEETGRELETYASSQSYGWGTHGVNVLARYGTDAAARILDDWHHKTRRDALRWRASSGVHQIAQRQGVSVEELLERSLPTFGFDARGELEIDFGSQRFTLRLGPLNAIEYVRDGVVLKSMPSRRVADDDELVAQAKAFIKLARADIKRITRAQRRRFEAAMFTGRSWEVSPWLERYARHPLMRSFIQGLVWGLCDAEGALVTPFQLDESYELVDAKDDPVAWTEGQRVRIIHPVEMTPTQRSAWTERFMDFEIIESFPQLTRHVYPRGDWPERGEALYMRLERVPEKVFLGHLNRQGYQLGAREDAGLINASSKSVGPYYITVSHSGFSPEFEMGTDLEIQGVTISMDGENVTLDDLPDNAFSEVVGDLVALTTP